jgi:hypothetical protein
MEISPYDRTTERTVSLDQRRTELRQMTAEQLLNLGKPRVAYVKASLNDDATIFVLYAADGKPILSTDDVEQAAEAATELDVEFATVH